ncbi:MAG: undecaprenyl-diphosphatase UppP [Methanobacteriaceae archaeon]|jgi:undecaprenyl-diphosphatase|nr:undecaprenyl-diphosphatase UppP [Methanobacteriaceae archaeon]MDO9628224.1 undecaprenyl-diphosphatase UppP [Methanobacteriaceae archaeon]
MDIIQAIIIGIVQGLTEFLPISSSAHLVFLPEIMGVQSSLAFDTLLHIGTLVAIFAYFWNDIINMIKSFFSSLADIPRGQFKKNFQEDQYKKLAWLVIIGTIPAGILGILFKSNFESLFSSILAVGIFLIITGFLLWGSERFSQRIRPEDRKPLKKLTIKNSLIVGIAQAFAIAPGISRSGATISAGLFLGFERELAARYSFLLSIPAILGAALVQAKDITSLDMSTAALVAGFLAAAISGYLAIKFMLKLIKERSLLIFAYYCWIVGIIAVALSLYFHI